MTQVRSLPLRIVPLPGEAVDSWLDAIASRCDTTWAELRVALGSVLPAVGYSDRWVMRLTDAQVAAISAATQLDPDALRSLTLIDYPPIAIGVDAQTGRSVSPFPWRHVHASRFCPYCLAESGGRWKLVWRMAWFFACPTHRCLLADACPECAGAQRRRSLAAQVPQPHHCVNVVDRGAPTAVPVRCNADLIPAQVTRLGGGHPALAAQAVIADALLDGTVEFGIYRRFPQPVPQMLADIRALGQYFLSDANPHVLNALVPSGLVAEHLELQHRARGRRRHRCDRASPSVSTAVAVTAALGILGKADIASAAEAMHSIWPSGRKYPLFGRITGPVNTYTPVSKLLRGVHLTALGPQLSATEQLRLRLGTALPRRPTRDIDDVKRMATRIPTVFWPEWSVRLAASRATQRTLRPVLSVALLLVGADLKVSDAVKMLGCPLAVPSVTAVLCQLTASRQWQDIRCAAYRLSSWLRRFGTPIDYQRRRNLDYAGLLPARTWKAICASTRTRPEGLSTARNYLFERLSATYAIAAPVTKTDAPAYDALQRFPTRLTPELNSVLARYALNFLAHHGITGEPVRWAPPAALLQGLNLAGDDPGSVDCSALQQLIRRDVLPLGAVADRLATSIDIVRLALEKDPAPRLPRTIPQQKHTVAAPGPAYQKASALLTRERFVQLYQTDERSLKDIAVMAGVCRQTVAELARDYGIALRKPGGRRTHIIDPEWLHDQHVNKGRPLRDLAPEAGVSLSILAKWAHIYGVPVRALSRYSPTALQDNKVPAVLIPVLSTQGGWERLQRLPRLAACDSFVAAAKRFHVSNAVLALQIATLERDLGGTILVRATSYRSQRLTPLGRRVIAAVNTLVEVGGP